MCIKYIEIPPCPRKKKGKRFFSGLFKPDAISEKVREEERMRKREKQRERE